jgi:hypothetical protein
MATGVRVRYFGAFKEVSGRPSGRDTQLHPACLLLRKLHTVLAGRLRFLLRGRDDKKRRRRKDGNATICTSTFAHRPTAIPLQYFCRNAPASRH